MSLVAKFPERDVGGWPVHGGLIGSGRFGAMCLRMLPKNFPPASTMRSRFHGWRNRGLWGTTNRILAAAWKLKGRKGSILSGPPGLVLFALVHGALILNSDAAPDLLKAVRSRFPWLHHIFAVDAHAGDRLRTALEGSGERIFGIIKRSDTAKGTEALPRRWIVVRTFAWLNHCRRRAKDWKRPIDSLTTVVTALVFR